MSANKRSRPRRFDEQRRARRQASIPPLEYPESLPVSARHQEIADAIAKHQVVLVCGETGSGKTTQLPKICLQAGRGIAGMIGHTQPRRIAARAVAARLAEEMNSDLGALVGFQTRFHKQLGPDNLVKVMTDGILLTEIQHDRWLNRYDTIIIDEAHERSLNIDFLLGYLRQLLKKRRDLKLIITSATIDADRIAAHFGNAPVIEVSGKTYPIEMRYRPAAEEQSLYQQIDEAIDELTAVSRGDILVFLPGEREIHEAFRSLRHRRDTMDILPLFSRLPAAEQQRIFRRGARQRVILSTNVAETSLTIPGIRCVVDSGLARISRYSWRTKIQRLATEKISQASARQRAGRCGREAPGICIRLYDEEDFNQRPAFTDPEILRTNLASVILQMASLRLTRVERFPFIDAPDARLVRDGYRLLEELQAIDRNRRLTSIGRQLARLPIDPRFGRMVLAAAEHGALREVLAIVTALSVRDPRERPYERQQAADEKHERFNDPRSDFITLVNLWNYLEQQHETLSQSRLRKLCQKEFLSYRRWREWRDMHHQLLIAAKQLKLRPNDSPAKYDQLHQSLLYGLLDHIAVKDEKHIYLGCRNRKIAIFPGSGLGTKTPKWLMAAEISQTTKLYARTVSGIQPQWVEHIGAHLLKHHYSEPHWQKKAARVGGFEKLTLYGLVINPRRRINYAAVDPVAAREIFIRFALVYGEWDCKIPVIRDNRRLIEDIESIEARLRQRNLLISDDDLYAFYDRILPPDIHSGAAFNKWFSQQADTERLRLTEDKLWQNGAPDRQRIEAFPLHWRQDGLRLPLSYHFEPGSEQDGVTLRIPLAVIRQIDKTRCEWLVPGLLEEKILAMIKALPKRLRKHFVPAPDFARAACEAITPFEGSLKRALSTTLQRMTGVAVDEAEWSDALPLHLLMRFEIYGEGRKTLAAGRDLDALRHKLSQAIETRPKRKQVESFERDNVTDWDFGDLPEHIDSEEDGYSIRRFPALSSSAQGVALRLFDTPEEASRAMHAGLRALLRLKLKQQIRYLEQNLPDIQQHCLLFSAIGTCQQLKNDLIDAAIEAAFLADAPVVRSAEAFRDLLSQGQARLVEVANTLAQRLGPILEPVARIRRQLKGNLPLNRIEAAADIRAQLDALIYPGFLLATPFERTADIPRYLAAIEKRLQKLDQSPDKDRMRRIDLEPLQRRYNEWPEEKKQTPDGIEYRWLLEELRVSLFAQELGVKGKVSPKRLERLARASL